MKYLSLACISTFLCRIVYTSAPPFGNNQALSHELSGEDPWLATKRHGYSVSDLECILGTKLETDSYLFEGVDFALRRPLQNACCIAKNALNRRPLTFELQKLVDGSARDCFPDIMPRRVCSLLTIGHEKPKSDEGTCSYAKRTVWDTIIEFIRRIFGYLIKWVLSWRSDSDVSLVKLESRLPVIVSADVDALLFQSLEVQRTGTILPIHFLPSPRLVELALPLQKSIWSSTCTYQCTAIWDVLLTAILDKAS